MHYRYYTWSVDFNNLRVQLWRKRVEKHDSHIYEISSNGTTWTRCFSSELNHEEFAKGSTKRISRYEAEKLFPKLFKRKKVYYYILRGYRKTKPVCLWRKQQPFDEAAHEFFSRGMKNWKKSSKIAACTDKQLKKSNLKRIGMRLARYYFPEAF